jgi:hypothetical protein
MLRKRREVRQADMAMDKASGRRTYLFFEAAMETVKERFQMEAGCARRSAASN